MSASQPLLQFQTVSKRYQRGSEEVHALDNVDLDVVDGEFLVVTGPSGAGKSTLLHVAGGLDKPDNGAVLFRGESLWDLSNNGRADFRRRNMGFVFQFFNLVPTLSAVENVSLPLVLDGVPAKAADTRAATLLARFGMGDRADHTPSELSGGQMQRVAVARALVADAPLVLADEPTGNLDAASSADVLSSLREAVDEYGTTVVMVTHDAEAASYGTRHIHLIDGRTSSQTAPLDPPSGKHDPHS